MVHPSGHAFSVNLGAIFEIAKLAFKVTCSGILKQGHYIVGENIHSGIGLGYTQPVRRFREGCRALGGEFDFIVCQGSAYSKQHAEWTLRQKPFPPA